MNQVQPASPLAPNGKKLLGAELLRCRPVSSMKWVASQGLGILGAWLALPFAVIPWFAAVISGGLVYWKVWLPDHLCFPAFCILFVCAYVLLIWLVYFQPRNDYFVLHEHGFRVNVTFKRRAVHFDELRALTFGLDSAAAKFLRSVLQPVKPGFVASMDGLGATAMNVNFKDGRTVVFKQLLDRFESDDLQQFLQGVANRHPEAFREMIERTEQRGLPA